MNKNAVKEYVIWINECADQLGFSVTLASLYAISVEIAKAWDKGREAWNTAVERNTESCVTIDTLMNLDL